MSTSADSWARHDESHAHVVLEGSEWSNADGAAPPGAWVVDENNDGNSQLVSVDLLHFVSAA